MSVGGAHGCPALRSILRTLLVHFVEFMCNQLTIQNLVFPNVDITPTMPGSNASEERSLSELGLGKTRLHSTTYQERLSHLTLMSSEIMDHTDTSKCKVIYT